MDTESIDTLLDHLRKTAASITHQSIPELQSMKSELDTYVADVTSKMPEQSKDIMNLEFTKCRVCAREWICVFNDSNFHTAVKDDILKEDVMEFFFSMNEKVLSVQKKFFLLGMVDELLTPGKPFSELQRNAKIAKSRIRIQAREQGLNASYKMQPAPQTGDQSSQRLWFFGDETNFLQSSEEGLTDEQALDYLLD
ncbi:MAG: hypothetical protein ACI8ZB_004137 [Desulforhopalus sp.]|jgi:hypothetical protein